MSKVILLKEIILSEGRKEFLKARYVDTNKVPYDAFNKILDADPTAPKYLYSNWLLNQYSKLKKKGDINRLNIFMDDLYKYKEDYLTLFNRLGHKYSKGRDINSYSLEEFESDSKELLRTNSAKANEVDPETGKTVRFPELLIGTTPTHYIYKLNEEKAPKEKGFKISQKLGAGTRWCTAATDRGPEHYCKYTKASSLYIFYPKSREVTDKYQLYYGPGELNFGESELKDYLDDEILFTRNLHADYQYPEVFKTLLPGMDIIKKEVDPEQADIHAFTKIIMMYKAGKLNSDKFIEKFQQFVEYVNNKKHTQRKKLAVSLDHTLFNSLEQMDDLAGIVIVLASTAGIVAVYKDDINSFQEAKEDILKHGETLLQGAALIYLRNVIESEKSDLTTGQIFDTIFDVLGYNLNDTFTGSYTAIFGEKYFDVGIKKPLIGKDKDIEGKTDFYILALDTEHVENFTADLFPPTPSGKVYVEKDPRKVTNLLDQFYTDMQTF